MKLLFVELYNNYELFSSSAAPVVELVHTFQNSAPFTITCTSTRSPATSVVWSKDGIVLTPSTVYHFNDMLADRRSATYIHTLQIETGPYNIVGSYRCSVENLAGSNANNITIEGKHFLLLY